LRCPPRTKEEVTVVYSDGFLSKDVLDNVGMTNSHHVLDSFHLRQLVWKKYFGPVHGNISGYVDQMCFAADEEEFVTAYQNARKYVSGKHQTELDKYGQAPELFAHYKVREYHGNLGRHGSSHSEQNHSSIVSRIGSCLLTEPHDTVKKFMQRQGELLNQTNAFLTKYKMNAEGKARSMESNDPRKLPLKQLSSWGYELWQEEHKKSKYIQKDAFNLLDGQRCACTTRISYFIQCRHELSQLGFNISKWDPRWHQRGSLEPSYNVNSMSSDDDLKPEDHDNVDIDIHNNNVIGDKDNQEQSHKSQLEKQPAGNSKKSESYSTQKGYGRLQQAFNPILVLASKKEDTCNTMVGFAAEIEEYLLTGKTIRDEEVKEWLGKLRSMGTSKKFLHVVEDISAIPARKVDIGRPPTKRYKSCVEMTANNIKKKSCRFCLQNAHNISTCTSARKYGRLLTTSDQISALIIAIRKHGSSRQQEKPSAETKMKVTSGVSFLSLIEYCEEGIKATCFSSGGKPMEGWTDQVFQVDAIIDWIIKVGKGYVLSKLD